MSAHENSTHKPKCDLAICCIVELNRVGKVETLSKNHLIYTNIHLYDLVR